MIDLARLHPIRVARGIRRRLLDNPPAAAVRPAPETMEETIARVTREKLTGRAHLPELSVTFTERHDFRSDATYHRDGERYVIELSSVDKQFDALNRTRELGTAYLYWLVQCHPQVQSLSVTLSDGEAASGARFAPSSNLAEMVPIPDPYFFRTSGFQAFREITPVAWVDRSDEVVWRGTSSGYGTFDPMLGSEAPGLAAQRLELLLAARNLPGVDIALVDYRRGEFKPELLERAGLIRPPVPEDSWAARKFAIDVDGWTNTWSNLFVRMLLGCCVLKLDSKFGFRQWYYDRLQPWEHYVPVKADGSDLGEKVEWVRANDDRAAEIAASGRRLAQSMTFETVQREAVDLITEHWRG